MASPVSDDQDQRSNTGLEDLTTMTIESLRARLLSERAISKSSRQRADGLARRVLELEEQLKMVSLQRKKAEKATADVLAILESNGMSDASDAYDSNYDQETISDSKASDDTMKRKETSSNFEVRRCDMEAYSSSEIDSSPSTGRSLSWKSNKESLHSLQKTKYMENVSRRCSTFTSNSTSFPKRVGKSCRRIRRRESRCVAEQLQNDANMHDLQDSSVDTFSKDSAACANIEHTANHGVNGAPETPVSGSPGNSGGNAYYSDRNAKSEDAGRTLQHQEQFRFEAEEKSQREWEEKVRENSSSVLDSCDPGNRSDVTEERDDMKASDLLNSEATRNTEKLASNLEVVKSSFGPELELKVAKTVVVPSDSDCAYLLDQKTSSLLASGSSLFPSNIDCTLLQDQKKNSLLASGSSSLEFTSSTSMGNQSQVFSGNLDKAPLPSSHISSISNGSLGILSALPSVSSKDAESSSTRNELALIPQNSSNNLESVLESLRQARLSLNQKLQGTTPTEIGSSVKGMELSVPGIRTEERMEMPFGFSGIFRLPTDFQSEPAAKVNYLGSNSASSFARGYHEASIERFIGSPYEERRSSALLGNQFSGNSSAPFTEIRPGVQSATPTATFPQGALGLHTSAIPFMERQPGISSSRAVYENAFDTGPSSSSRSCYSHPQMNPGLPASAMPFMEIQPGISASKPVYENAFDTGSSSSGRSSYVDRQMNPGLVLPSRYTSLAYPFYPEVAQQVPSDSRLPRHVPSKEYVMPPSSGFSFYYDDHSRPNV